MLWVFPCWETLIPLLDIDLFIFLYSFWSILEAHICSENLSISSNIPTHWYIDFKIFPTNHLNFRGMCCNISIFISTFIYWILSLSLFLFVSLAKGFSFQKASFFPLIFSVICLTSVSFISALSFIISSLLLLHVHWSY